MREWLRNLWVSESYFVSAGIVVMAAIGTELAAGTVELPDEWAWTKIAGRVLVWAAAAAQGKKIPKKGHKLDQGGRR